MHEVLTSQMGEHKINTNTPEQELEKSLTLVSSTIKVLQDDLDVQHMLNRDSSHNLDELYHMLYISPTTSHFPRTTGHKKHDWCHITMQQYLEESVAL